MFAWCCKKKLQTEDNYSDEFTPSDGHNVYLGKRNLVHSMVDFGLLAANGSQLKAVLNTEHHRFFEISISLISLSMALQVAFVVCMLIITLKEKNIAALKNRAAETKPLTSPVNPNQDPGSSKASGNEQTDGRVTSRLKRRLDNSIDRLDLVGNILVMLIVVVNVLIFSFGIEDRKSDSDR